MNILKIDHFHRAIADIVAHGDNDILPFDVDTRFIAECSDSLAVALNFGDDGKNFQIQVRKTIPNLWSLGFERRSSNSFADTFLKWVSNGA